MCHCELFFGAKPRRSGGGASSLKPCSLSADRQARNDTTLEATMKIKRLSFDIVHADMAKLDVDAVVLPGKNIPGAEAGSAKIVKKSGQLKAKQIIHTAVVDQGKDAERILRKACAEALRLASTAKIPSIAFLPLSEGSDDLPLQGIARIMIQEVIRFSRGQSDLRKIIFCCPDKKIYLQFRKTILGYVRHFHDDLGWGPYLTVDIIIEMEGGIILIERSNPPYGWALPGGFLDYGETLEEAAAREAKEETRMDLDGLRQFHAYSDPRRDPRFHTVSIAFAARGKGKPQAGDDAKGLKVVKFADLDKIELAFDHKQIIKDYLAQKS